jgi:glycosyltransferase involved in cell wall biosynthesis
MSPKISICILTFNSAAFIAEAVESAINQTFKDIEIVIVDNGSTDTTLDICNQLKNKDSRVSIHKNEVPLGISGGLNSCVDLAKGQYIKFLMHDDLLEPNCLEKMIRPFEQFPTVTLVGCSEQLISSDGSPLEVLEPYASTGPIPGRTVAKEILYKMSNIIGTPTSILIKRETYGAGFKRSLFLFQDAEVYVRALLQGDYYFINEKLSKVRVHDKTGSSINTNTLVFISDILQLRDTYADFMQEQGLSKEEWFKLADERVLSWVGHMLQKEGLTEESVRAYANKLRGLVGYDYTEQLLESMVCTIFYGFSRLFKLDLEAKWNEKENQRLSQEVNLMSKSLPFRITQPLRSLRSKLLNLDQI